MKTFIFSLPSRLKSFNDKLDVKGALCGKSWEVFNDEGVKQLFIFNTDGTLLITTNGKVLMSSWQFIPANASVIITAENETTMFHPAFYDNVIFALQQDGVDRYLFMIDEQQKNIFPEITLNALNEYFEEKKRKAIEEEKNSPIYIAEQKQKRKEEAKRIKVMQEEERREKERLKAIEEEKKQIEEAKKQAKEWQLKKEQEAIAFKKYLIENKDVLLRKYAKRKRINKTISLLVIFTSLVLIIIGFSFKNTIEIVGGVIGVFIIVEIISYSISQETIEDYFRTSYERENKTRLEGLNYDRIKEIYEEL